jgi:hypothetical protein
MTKDKLLVLKEHPYYEQLIEELKTRIPIVPDYDPEDIYSGEKMKALSMKRQGFLLAITIMTGVVNV